LLARSRLGDQPGKATCRAAKPEKTVGISTPEQFAAVGKFAEGAVVGSAIVQLIEQNPGREAAAVAEFVKQLLASSS